MKTNILKLIFGLLIGIYFVPTQTALAKDANFTFTYKKQLFTVNQDTLDAWSGRQFLAPSKILNEPPTDFKKSLLVMAGGVTPSAEPRVYRFKLEPIYEFLSGVAAKINVSAAEPVLKIEDFKVLEFTPPQTGISLDIYSSALNAIKLLETGEKTSELSVFESAPKNSLAETNSLGIQELVAQGVSDFRGSPKNRRFNIAKGTEKFKGIIIPKGETFSFNKFLGPVDEQSGFLPELVIKKEGTVPEFGGGLCQVSSTAFRAAMQAGLPIIERRNHAYAVQYYSPQGTDATIYPGSVDLKFINDTPGAILIWPYEKDSNTLIFDFYGTKDGRKVVLERPVITDKKDDGSMKAAWTRTVTKEGATKTITFHSTYQSPALFHKTEQFVGTPTSTPALSPTTKPVQ